jgi:hypothetical protein
VREEQGLGVDFIERRGKRRGAAKAVEGAQWPVAIKAQGASVGRFWKEKRRWQGACSTSIE